MTVDFILHGVPNGQDFWGASDDSHYFSTFYVQKSEKEYLTIEARKVSGKSYCYYNYLKYNNITGADSRAGAYLGITLRFDAYYKDILNIYQLFEIIYNNLLDTILVKNGESIKFKVAKFEAADSELNDIKKKVVNLIQLSATAKDFVALNDSFFKNEDKTISAFLLDCTPDNVVQALKKYGKVEVSKYCPSINESKKMRSIEDRFTSTITQKDKDLEEKNQQISKLNDECQGLKTDLSTSDLNLYIGENKKEDVLNINNIIMNYQESIDDIINIIKFILNTYKQKTVELQALNNRNSLLDKELVDLDHLIEFNNLSASQGFQVYKIQQQKFQQRRYVKNLIFAYQQLLSLFDEEKSINALLSIKGLENQKYAPRTELYCDLLYSMKGVERCDE